MACPWQTGTRGHLPHRQLSPSSNSSEIQVHIRAVHPPSHGQWGKVGGRHLCTDRHRSEVGNGWADPHPHCNWRNWLLRTSTEFSKRNQSLAVNIRGCLLPTINKVISFSHEQVFQWLSAPVGSGEQPEENGSSFWAGFPSASQKLWR